MGKKILLADDSITIQKVIELTFSDEDFEVVTVGNGRLAVERVLDVRPDIVLCDIIMPEKDGYEVCDFIKRSPQLSNVPVLLLTGAFEPFDQERAARVACDGFLAKPFEPETLIAKVKDLLQKASARGSSVTGPRMAVQVPAPAPPPPPVVAAAPPPPPVVQTPPEPVAPAPTPLSFEPAVREPIPFAPPPTPPSEEVRFIPDEPFDDLESAGFAPPSTPPPSEAAVAEPTIPPLPMEPEVYSVPDEVETEPELLQMTPEESQSLVPPVAADDSSSTVVFRPAASPWTQQPTIELPLEARAQASVESAQAASAPADDTTVFEEVLEEDVENLVGGELEPEPPVTSTTVAFGAASAEAPPPPPPSSAAVAEPPSSFAPEPLPTEAPIPEPVVPALERVVPLQAAAIPMPPPPEAKAAPQPESFAGVAPPAPEPVEPAPSLSAEVPVPNDMVAQIAQRVVAQISEKVVRQIAWEVIPDLAEGLIKKEIERLKAELQET